VSFVDIDANGDLAATLQITQHAVAASTYQPEPRYTINPIVPISDIWLDEVPGIPPMFSLA
jgi:hypothetical protein